MDFFGKHAEYLQRLAPDKRVSADIRKQTVFSSMIEAVVAASLIGFVCGRKNKETRECIFPENKGVQDFKKSIFAEQVISNSDILIKNYRLIMILDNKDNIPISFRLDRAFRYDNDVEKRKAGDLIFKEYLLGGLEILYEELIKDTEKDTDGGFNIFMNCNRFIENCKLYSKKEFFPEDIYALCRQAGV